MIGQNWAKIPENPTSFLAIGCAKAGFRGFPKVSLLPEGVPRLSATPKSRQITVFSQNFDQPFT